jgi:hypothetical protein
MVIYICNICSKIFNKKSNYLTHISNKKKPCKDYEKINYEKINYEKINYEKINYEKINYENIVKNYKCNFCSKTFSRVDNLKRHLIERCKVRKEETQEKEAIFSNLLQRVELLEKENLQLNNKIVLLENKKETKNIQYNKNIKNLNNGIINNTFIIQHGKEDFSKIDDKVL